MADDPLIHPYKLLTTPAGDQVEIDIEMVPIVELLWQMRFQTTACCEDVGEATRAVRDAKGITAGYRGEDFIAYYSGWALLKLPLADALRLFDMLACVPSLAPHVQRRWMERSWRMTVPLVRQNGAAALDHDALLHFPASHIPALVQALDAMSASQTVV